MRRYLAAAAVALTITAVTAVPAQAAKQRTTITDTVVALSGSSCFDAN